MLTINLHPWEQVLVIIRGLRLCVSPIYIADRDCDPARFNFRHTLRP